MVYLPWSGILSITYTFTTVSLAHYYSSAFYHEVAKCMLETREEGGSWLIPGLSTALLLFLANDPAKGKKRGTPRGSGFRLLSNDHLDSFHFIVYSFRSYLHITTSLRSLCLPLIFADLQPYTKHSVCNSSAVSQTSLGFLSEPPRSPSMAPRHYRRSANAQSMPSEIYAAVLSVPG